jgi:transcriptional regulator with XRE-family HTH domain
MLTKETIEQFYKDVEVLGLEHPVAALVEKTGVSKGQISKVLNRKLKPSKTLIDKFYESFNLVSPGSSNGATHKTLTEALEIIKQQNAFMQRLVESNLVALSTDVNNNAAAIRAEIRGYAQRQILKEVNYDDGEFLKAKAEADKIYLLSLKQLLGDNKGNAHK